MLDAHYGTAAGATWDEGDFNFDGAVDVLDLDILAAYFGSGGGCDPTAFFETLAAYPRMQADFVPEPGAAGLVVFAAVALTARRRRRPRGDAVRLRRCGSCNLSTIRRSPSDSRGPVSS